MAPRMQPRLRARCLSSQIAPNMRSTLLFLFAMLTTFASAALPAESPDDDCHARGFVGVTSEVPNTRKLQRLGYEERGGAFIRNVVGCTGAENAGIRPLDYLIGVDGEIVSRSRHFFCLLEDVEPGTEVRVTLLRDGERMDTDLTIGRRRDACQDETPYPKRGFFGLNDGDTDTRPGVVVDVSSGGPVAELGMRDGDRILRIDGHPVNDWGDISSVKRLLGDVDDVAFEIERDDEPMMLRGPIDDDDDDSWNSWSWNHDDEDGQAVYVNGERIEQTVREALESVDFEQIERDIEQAMDEIDFEEIGDESREAARVAMEAVREAFAGSSDWDDDDSSWNRDVVAGDLAPQVEPVDDDEVARMRDRGVDMPRQSDLDLEVVVAKPNPNAGRFTLTFDLPQRGQTEVAVYSATGQEVYRYDLGSFSGAFSDELDIMRNGPGSYFLVVRQDERALVRKILVVDN